MDLQECRTCSMTYPLTSEFYTWRSDSKKFRTDCNSCRSRQSQLARYGISPLDYTTMYKEQKGCCKICGIHEDHIEHKSFKHNRLVIDHCHTSGKVRGLLCNECNRGLGAFKDSTSSLASAIEYLS